MDRIRSIYNFLPFFAAKVLFNIAFKDHDNCKWKPIKTSWLLNLEYFNRNFLFGDRVYILEGILETTNVHFLHFCCKKYVSMCRACFQPFREVKLVNVLTLNFPHLVKAIKLFPLKSFFDSKSTLYYKIVKPCTTPYNLVQPCTNL